MAAKIINTTGKKLTPEKRKRIEASIAKRKAKNKKKSK